MQFNKVLKPIFILNALLLTPYAMAHEGHGLGAGSHWHAADSWGWIVGLAVVAILWGARKP